MNQAVVAFDKNHPINSEPDFLTRTSVNLKNAGYHVYPIHRHHNDFDMLKVNVNDEDGNYSHQVWVFHDSDSGFIEAYNTKTGANETSDLDSSLRYGAMQDLTDGLYAFLDMDPESPHAKAIYKQMYLPKPIPLPEGKTLPSEIYKSFQQRRARHRQLHST